MATRILAVNFHFVGNITAQKFPGIHNRTEDEFVDQLDALQSAGDILSPRELEAAINGEANLKGFVLTFDDGLRDHVEFVLPELKRRGLSAFYFLNTAAQAGEILAVHKLQLLNAMVPFEELWRGLEREIMERGISSDVLRTPEATIRQTYTYDPIDVARFKWVTNLGISAGQQGGVVDGLFRSLMPVDVAPEDLYINSDEVRLLHDEGHKVGGHTHRHLALSRMSAAERGGDLKQNLAGLRSMLGGGVVEWFSFPFGDESAERVGRLCEEMGVQYGFTMNRGYITESSSPLLLERVDTNDAPGGKHPKYT